MRLRLGLELSAEGGAPALVYVVRCIFCKREHRSAFFDEIEEEILACRDSAPEWQKGRLADFKDPGMRPISVETTAYAQGYV